MLSRPSIEELNAAGKLAAQKLERRILAKVEGDASRSALEQLNFEAALDEYHSLLAGSSEFGVSVARSAQRRIYIAGPMRGYPEHNFPAFNRAAERFRALGWAVENPVEIGEAVHGNGNPDVPGGEYLRADVRRICECTAIAVLPGWECSTGARAVVALSITMGLDFYDAGTMQRISAPKRVTICGGYERPAGAVDSLDAVVEDILAWQIATFTQRTPHSITNHLLREAKELHATPHDDEEWADVLFLAIALIQDGTRNAPRDIVGALRAKLAKNKARAWGAPDTDGVVEHIAEGVQ